MKRSSGPRQPPARFDQRERRYRRGEARRRGRNKRLALGIGNSSEDGELGEEFSESSTHEAGLVGGFPGCIDSLRGGGAGACYFSSWKRWWGRYSESLEVPYEVRILESNRFDTRVEQVLPCAQPTTPRGRISRFQFRFNSRRRRLDLEPKRRNGPLEFLADESLVNVLRTTKRKRA